MTIKLTQKQFDVIEAIFEGRADFEIVEEEQMKTYYAVINDTDGVLNDTLYETEAEAKIAAFDYIKSDENGTDVEYIVVQEVHVKGGDDESTAGD